MLGSMSKWIYDESPTDGLRFEKPLAELKEKIKESQSQVFKDMIQVNITTKEMKWISCLVVYLRDSPQK